MRRRLTRQELTKLANLSDQELTRSEEEHETWTASVEHQIGLTFRRFAEHPHAVRYHPGEHLMPEDIERMTEGTRAYFAARRRRGVPVLGLGATA